ncbi:PIN domain-containing protein [Streptomyces sparsogenes]|uniref:PIN domain-containing protein n=1 Tax=Streptomyces sparsogenes TaxID=67365 RepID=UPI0033FA5B4E
MDTNLLPRQGKLRNVSISTLLRVAGTLSSTVAITSTVLSESINARRRDAEEALDRHAKAVSNLSKYCQLDSYYVPSLESIVQEWEDGLKETFVILELDGEDAKEALVREAMRRKPAKADGTGARDSAIWLCIKRRHLAGTHVTHFASNNTDDFGAKKGDSSLHSDLLGELGDRAEDFRYHTSINSVIEALCARTQVSLTSASFPEDVLLSIVEQVVTHQDLAGFPDFADRSPEDFGPIESLELAEMRVRSAYSAAGVTVGFLTASFVMPLAVEVHETLGTSVSGRLGGWFELADDTVVVRFDVSLLRELAHNRP